MICRTLRYLAHSHGATLQFYSALDTGLVKKVTSTTPLLPRVTRVPQARDLLSHHAFETPAATGVSQDYNKPLIIPAGSDSFQVSSTSTSQHLVCVASTSPLRPSWAGARWSRWR